MASGLYSADRFQNAVRLPGFLNITCSWEISDNLLGYLISPCWVSLTPGAILGYQLSFLAKPSGTLNFLPDLSLVKAFQNPHSCSFRGLSISRLACFFSTKPSQECPVGNRLSVLQQYILYSTLLGPRPFCLKWVICMRCSSPPHGNFYEERYFSELYTKHPAKIWWIKLFWICFCIIILLFCIILYCIVLISFVLFVC